MSDLIQTLRDEANKAHAYAKSMQPDDQVYFQAMGRSEALDEAADKLVEVLDYVWCDKEGDVHDDTLNPYGYNESIPDQDLCKPEDHHKLYREVTP